LPEALYQKLIRAISVPVTETPDTRTKGILIERGKKPKIYINQSLPPPEKFMALLHEYAHYLHMTKYFEDESRAESELIAGGTAFFVLRELDTALPDEPILTEAIRDPDRLKHLAYKIQLISREIISLLK
jgi:hypothetical protein